MAAISQTTPTNAFSWMKMFEFSWIFHWILFLMVHWFRQWLGDNQSLHYNDIIMSMIASQITSLTSVYSTVYLGTDKRKHQSSTSLAFVRRIHRRPGNSPHKGPVTREMFPFDDVIMYGPLSEPMMVRLPTHICATRPQWVKGYNSGFLTNFHYLNFIGVYIGVKLHALCFTCGITGNLIWAEVCRFEYPAITVTTMATLD